MTGSLFDAVVQFDTTLRKLDDTLMRYALRRGGTLAESERIGNLRRRLRAVALDLTESLLV